VIAATAFWLLNLSRQQKQQLQFVFDLIISLFSFFLVFAVAGDLGYETVASLFGWACLYSSALGLIAYRLRLYQALVRFSGVRVLVKVFLCCTAAALIVFLMSAIQHRVVGAAAMTIVGVTTAVFMSSGRLLLRELFYRIRKTDKPNVVIYGAGDAGRQLLTAFAQSSSHRVVAMIDDSPLLHGKEIYGVRVYPFEELTNIQKRHKVEAVILAAPSISRQRKNEILHASEGLGLPLQSVPSVSEILSGKKSIANLQQIHIEDVLGRDPIIPDFALMRKKIAGRSVMVTGGGGSIGSELCLQIASLDPTCLVIVESSEFALYRVLTTLEDKKIARRFEVVPILQSVLDEQVLLDSLEKYQVQTVFHAAAYKHVPLVELNPFEGLRNNVFGTLSVLKASQAAGVLDFVLISTDKAVRPTNIMGATKRVAELVLQAHDLRQAGMCVSMVRFGNVLSSSGSVIPRFREQIQVGGPVTVTHPEISRFFMTIPEAVELVLQANGLAEGGEVFLLDMGEPVRIVDLARRMIRLSGYRPVEIEEDQNLENLSNISDYDILIKFTGLRPGEKLYEELLISGNAIPTEHPKIFRAKERAFQWQELESSLNRLYASIGNRDIDEVCQVFRDLQVEYSDTGNKISVYSPDNKDVSARPVVQDKSTLPTQVSPDDSKIPCDKSITAPNDGGIRGDKKINPFLSKLLHGYFLLRRPMTMGVRALVINVNDEVMLVRHRYEPGYQLPGGGVETNESPIVALHRELFEEVGIKFDNPSEILGCYFNAEVSRRDHVLVYVIREFEVLSDVKISPEISDHRFFPFDRLPLEATLGTRRRIAEVFHGRAPHDVW
jgi:FlaA1/EpsC-like NDP-sugar epimerase/8-oxo-dGTP pyrophosphatase MutT (NUDIX family)